MKWISFLAVVVSPLALTLTGCNEEQSAKGSSVEVTTETEYPLTTCVVSGEKLGSMGEPYTLVHEGTTVKLCCSGCEDEFKANPQEFLAKLSSSN